MGKQKPQLVICRTCHRDNPGEGDFANFASAAKKWKRALVPGIFNKIADVKYQNCFAQCENFYCVQVTQNHEGFLLKKISTPEKMNQVIDWITSAPENKPLQIPESLRDEVLKQVSVQGEKYHKIK